MKLYHYTSTAHLRGIGRYGLTVGDVPTNLPLVEGKIGIWLTTSPSAVNHGLEGSAVDKTEVRMAVELPDAKPLCKWDDWAPRNATRSTIDRLEAGRTEAARTWFVYFGWISPASITEVVSMRTGDEIRNWKTLLEEADSSPAWPYWRRKTWQRKLLKNVRKTMVQRAELW